MSKKLQFNRGDMITTDLPHKASADKLIVLLVERKIPFQVVTITDQPTFDSIPQVLVPASHGTQFEELGSDIVNEWELGNKYDIETFQGEFIISVYDDKLDAFVDFCTSEATKELNEKYHHRDIPLMEFLNAGIEPEPDGIIPAKYIVPA